MLSQSEPCPTCPVVFPNRCLLSHCIFALSRPPQRRERNAKCWHLARIWYATRPSYSSQRVCVRWMVVTASERSVCCGCCQTSVYDLPRSGWCSFLVAIEEIDSHVTWEFLVDHEMFSPVFVVLMRKRLTLFLIDILATKTDLLCAFHRRIL